MIINNCNKIGSLSYRCYVSIDLNFNISFSLNNSNQDYIINLENLASVNDNTLTFMI